MPQPSVSPPRPTARSRWSWSVGHIAGIPVRIHVTMLLLLAWLAIGYSLQGLGPSATLIGIVLIAMVFVIVLVHELGHALMARRFGVATRDILLLPIGGIASLERIPERPAHELAISVIGPAINIVLAGLLWGLVALAGWDLTPGKGVSLAELFVVQLLWINVVLAAFNLLPAFPLDGGRALRALLSMRMTRERATRIAGGLGKLLAVVLAMVGLASNPWLVLIALVVWVGARQELEITRLRTALAGLPASAAMQRRIDTVELDEPLETAATILVGGGSTAIPVVEHGATVGVLTTSDVASGIAAAGADAPISSAPRHPAVMVPPTEPLDRVLDLLQSSPEAIAVVVDRGALVGILTPEQLASYVALHQ